MQALAEQKQQVCALVRYRACPRVPCVYSFSSATHFHRPRALCPLVYAACHVHQLERQLQEVKAKRKADAEAKVGTHHLTPAPRIDSCALANCQHAACAQLFVL